MFFDTERAFLKHESRFSETGGYGAIFAVFLICFWPDSFYILVWIVGIRLAYMLLKAICVGTYYLLAAILRGIGSLFGSLARSAQNHRQDPSPSWAEPRLPSREQRTAQITKDFERQLALIEAMPISEGKKRGARKHAEMAMLRAMQSLLGGHS